MNSKIIGRINPMEVSKMLTIPAGLFLFMFNSYKEYEIDFILKWIINISVKIFILNLSILNLIDYLN